MIIKTLSIIINQKTTEILSYKTQKLKVYKPLNLIFSLVFYICIFLLLFFEWMNSFFPSATYFYLYIILLSSSSVATGRPRNNNDKKKTFKISTLHQFN